MFGLPFYQLGYLYKTHLEKRDKINNYLYFFILFIIQFILYNWSNGKISSIMVTATFNNSESNIIMPFLVGCTGIMFWMKISKILEPSFKNSKGIQFISKNTWTIMMHHQFVFFIINLVFFILKKMLGVFNTEVCGINMKPFTIINSCFFTLD